MPSHKFLSLALAVCLVGCTQIPKDAFKLSPTSLKDRQIQTRLYETSDETSLLAAGIAVLQDMGYSIDKTEKAVGLIAASKTVDATNGAQIAGSIIIALLGGQPPPVDKTQLIRVSLVTSPSKLDKKGYLARITFQRVVINSRGQVSRVETLTDKNLYNEFFDKLSKSVFLEAEQI
jgi:hypothetical protein